jgi:glycosyltransferase involved in cell wall biosynthesis
MIAYTHYENDPRVIRAAEAATSEGFDVDFLALRRKGNPPVENVRGVRVIRLGQQRYRGGGTLRYMLSYLEFFFRCMVKSAALHASRRYRVVHVNNMPDFLVFSAVFLKMFGAKVILDIHDPMPDTFVSKFKNGDGRFIYKLLLWQELASAWFSDRVLTVHDPVKDCILTKHGLKPGSITVVANFADDQLFALREWLPIEGHVRLVFHGTILERYGLGSLVRAYASLEHRQNLCLRIIGEGDYSEELRKLIESLGLSDSVEFINRAFPWKEIPNLISDCHAGVIPLEIGAMTNYALPLKLLECISLGMPVVTVKNAAISYYFDENDCIFYEPNNLESLRGALERVAQNPEILKHYRERAVALRDKFLWSNEKRKYIELLRELSGCSQRNTTE